MSDNIHRWPIGLAAGLALVMATAAPSRAQHPELIELLRRVPDSTNALVIVKANELFDAPLALREQWRERRHDAPSVAPDATRDADYVVFASRMNLVGGLERAWEIGLAHLAAPTTPQAIVRAEGGTLDELGGKPLIWSPRKAFIVPFAPRVVAMAFFDDRQAVARWIASTEGRTDLPLSPYLAKVAEKVQGYDHQVVMAFDLGYLVSAKLAKAHLARSNAIDLKNDDLDAMAGAVASAQGIVLAMKVTDGVDGLIRVDFAESTAPLARVAKPLMFEILDSIAMPVDAMKDWRIKVEDRAITLQGRLTSAAARDVVSLVDLPTGDLGGDPSKPDPDQETTPGAAPGAPTAKATKHYFSGLTNLLDDLKKEKSDTQKHIAMWAERYATKIDRMAILGVDPELLDFAAKLSASFRDLSNTAKGVGLQTSYARAANTGATVGGFYGYGYGVSVSGTSLTAVTATNRAATAQASAYQNTLWAEIDRNLAIVDRSLTERYGVEF